MTIRPLALLTLTPLTFAGAFLVGCKDKESASSNALIVPVPSASVTTAASAPATSATAAAKAAVAAAKPAPATSGAKTVPPTGAKLAKKGKGVELSIWDTSAPPDLVESCGDGDIVVVLPVFLDADPWKVKVDNKGLGTPTQDLRKGWRGPNSDSEAFRWNALKASPGNYVATFTSGQDVVKVDIKVDPAHIPCE